MKQDQKRERGAVILTVALYLALLLGFAALATECGRWYLIRAELSKSVDAGALEGAKNISNPYVNPVTLAKDFCAENFAGGAFGTPGSGTGVATFTAAFVGTNKIQVNGTASAQAFLAKIVGFDQIPVKATGAAAMRKVEIILVLDRSYSMQGTALSELKKAATTFVDYFATTQATDKMGMISFSTGVKIDRAMGTNYVAPMKTAINNLNVDWATNIEDALDQTDGASGFTNQTGVPAEDRVQQIVVLFSDGYPTAFRDNFKYNNVTYDAAVFSGSECDGSSGTITQYGNSLYNPNTGATNGVPVTPTGTGTGPTTRWLSFDTYPIAGYAPTANIPGNKLNEYVCQASSAMAIAQAKVLKDKGTLVFVIGLDGLSSMNKSFFDKIASAPDMVYITHTAADLQALFTLVAKQIKLRLVA